MLNKQSGCSSFLAMFRVMMLIVLGGCALSAQNTASITGTITDKTGAVVPGAVVTLVNTATSATVNGKSNNSGIYLVSFLSPGDYTFTVESPSFRRYTRNLTLVTGQVLSLDLTLEVGATSDTLTVTSETPLVQAATSDVSHLVEQAFIQNMPLESDRSGALVRLLPGVTFISEETFEPQLNFSIAGGQGRSGEYRLDGGNITLNALLTRTTEFNPPVEATQEMKVEVNGYSAEYGHSTGGVFSITSKSGTNQFHGAVYENFRNSELDARSFFAPSVAPRRYNVYGAEIDGPIRKDKTFFMFSFEGTRRVDGQTRVYSYPSRQQVTGNFSDQATPVIDPLTRLPFTGNIIPASRLDAVGAKLAALYPAPNVAGARPGANNYIANTSDRVSGDTYFGKVDHIFNDRDRISGRFIEYPSTQVTGNAIPNRAEDPNAQSQNFNLINISPSWFHTFGPTLFNEARYTYSHRNGEFPSFEGYGVAGQVGLSGVPSSGVPEVNVTGLTSLGRSNQWRYLKPQITHTLDETMTWFRGKHNVKFGGEWRRSSNRDTWGTSASGQLGFNNVLTGSGLAALELGWVTTANVVTGDTITRTDYLGAFVQDDWKVTSRLTLNIGVRYDLDTPRWETRNYQTGFDPSAINPVSGTPGIITYAGQNGVSKYAHNWDINNIGPRFGFAWNAPHDLFVLRGGYGLVFGPEYDASLGRAMNTSYSDNRAISSPDNGVTPAFILSSGVPNPGFGSGAGFGAVRIGQPTVFSPDFIDQDHQNLYAHHFNASLQRQLSGTMLLELEYLGNMGHRIGGGGTVNVNEVLPQLRGATQNQVLRPYPQYGNVLWRSPDWGNSTYNALNIKVEKRFSGGLNFLTTYTWSKFLDDIAAPSELATAANGGQQSYYARHLDKGLSGNDIRHRVTASFVYEFPVGKRKRFAIQNSLLDAVIGGWSLGMIAELRSGAPYSVYEQTNRLNSFSPGQRSNLVADPELATDRPRAQLVQQWFNTLAFVFPGNGVLGNASKSPGTGPGFANFDTSLLKDFHLTEKRYVQFRSQFYNLFNRPNFANPNGLRGNAAFGQISSTVNGGRFIQLSL
ncbi:MAG: TonB-dependent receptor domain-containing protein, partial [Bryobacteraceae bacterium]